MLQWNLRFPRQHANPIYRPAAIGEGPEGYKESVTNEKKHIIFDNDAEISFHNI